MRWQLVMRTCCRENGDSGEFAGKPPVVNRSSQFLQAIFRCKMIHHNSPKQDTSSRPHTLLKVGEDF